VAVYPAVAVLAGPLFCVVATMPADSARSPAVRALAATIRVLRVIVVPLFWQAIVSQACRVTDDVCESKRKAAPRQVQCLAVDEVKQGGQRHISVSSRVASNPDLRPLPLRR
jgi:hypothetical protein